MCNFQNFKIFTPHKSIYTMKLIGEVRKISYIYASSSTYICINFTVYRVGRGYNGHSRMATPFSVLKSVNNGHQWLAKRGFHDPNHLVQGKRPTVGICTRFIRPHRESVAVAFVLLISSVESGCQNKQQIVSNFDTFTTHNSRTRNTHEQH